MSVPPVDSPERTPLEWRAPARDVTHLERAASWLSLACAVHCLVMPVALALLPVLGASSLALNEDLDHVLTALVLVSASGGAIWGYRRHHDARFLVATAVGLACYLAGTAPSRRWWGRWSWPRARSSARATGTRPSIRTTRTRTDLSRANGDPSCSLGNDPKHSGDLAVAVR
jgi:hypothetical protein